MSIDINDPEVQGAIRAAIEEEVKGLKAKNSDLLEKLKKATKNAEIDPDDYHRLKDENESLSDKLSDAQKAIKTALSDTDKFKKAAESESNFVSKLLVETGLNDALTKAGVKPELSKAVKALFASQAAIKIEGDNRQAVIGDKDINSFVTEWAASDEGKHFIAAPLNSGGGASGGGGQSGSVKSMSRSEFDAKSPIERATFFKSGGKLVD